MASNFLRCCHAVISIFLVLIPACRAGSTYNLDTAYSGSTFFDGFDFYTGSDPTHGFVNYVSRQAAGAQGLISSGGFAGGGPTYMGVDFKTSLAASGPGRNSVRISSKKSFTHGLFIADIAHMPGGICGTWPAYWMFGPNWPNSGEIDIIEGVNSNQNNLISLHTSANCAIAGTGEIGTVQTSNCDGNTNNNAGCGVTASTTTSYGAGFNAISGGVYATEWTSQYIKTWFFPRTSIPSDITTGKPDPSTWGLPQANFQGSCDIDSHFANHNIIFDTTFCGDWGGSVWSSDSVCKGKAATCEGYVAANPAAFKNAYWSINYVKVFKLGQAPTPTPSTPKGGTFGGANRLAVADVKPNTVESDEGLATATAQIPYALDPRAQPGSPSLHTSFSTTTRATTSARRTSALPTSSVHGLAMGTSHRNATHSNSTSDFTVLTTTYKDLCTCPAHTLNTHTLTTTLPHNATLPMRTTINTCYACGPALETLTFTLTLPPLNTTTSAVIALTTKNVLPLPNPNVTVVKSTETLVPVKATPTELTVGPQKQVEEIVVTGGGRRREGCFGAVVGVVGFAVLAL